MHEKRSKLQNSGIVKQCKNKAFWSVRDTRVQVNALRMVLRMIPNRRRANTLVRTFKVRTSDTAGLRDEDELIRGLVAQKYQEI